MATYEVTWKIIVTAEKPSDAALAALKVQRDPKETEAAVFKVEALGSWEEKTQWAIDLKTPARPKINVWGVPKPAKA